MRLLALLLLLHTSLLAQDPTPPAAETGPAPAPAATAPQEPAGNGVTVQPVVQTPSGEMVLSPRIRNITRLHNSMPHQLIGIGIVTGLANTGSSDRGTRQAILNVVRQLGLNLSIADVVGGTTALVSLTCTLPPFAKNGRRLRSCRGSRNGSRGADAMERSGDRPSARRAAGCMPPPASVRCPPCCCCGSLACPAAASPGAAFGGRCRRFSPF